MNFNKIILIFNFLNSGIKKRTNFILNFAISKRMRSFIRTFSLRRNLFSNLYFHFKNKEKIQRERKYSKSSNYNSTNKIDKNEKKSFWRVQKKV